MLYQNWQCGKRFCSFLAFHVPGSCPFLPRCFQHTSRGLSLCRSGRMDDYRSCSRSQGNRLPSGCLHLPYLQHAPPLRLFTILLFLIIIHHNHRIPLNGGILEEMFWERQNFPVWSFFFLKDYRMRLLTCSAHSVYKIQCFSTLSNILLCLTLFDFWISHLKNVHRDFFIPLS